MKLQLIRITKSVHFKRAAWVALALFLLSTALFARVFWVIKKAESIVSEKGFTAYASELLQPYRHLVTSSERGCKIYLTAAFEGRMLDRADWGAQSCFVHGKEIPEVFIALAGVRELTQREGEALQILQAAQSRYKEDATILYKLARLLVKAGKNREATEFLIQAADKVQQNASIQAEVLSFLLQNKDLGRARPLVERIRNAKDAGVFQKILASEALFQLGDLGSAKELLNSAASAFREIPERGREEIKKLAPRALEELTKLERTAPQGRPTQGPPMGSRK